MWISAQQFQMLIAPFACEREPVLIAVSGGADSLALVLLYDEWLRTQGLDPALLHTVTVDHRLRPESAEEAQTVHTWLQNKNIQHKVLVWDHFPFSSQIEEQARIARYSLLHEYYEKHHLSYCLTAHHALDQLETLSMRLARGAGLTGLCGMLPRSQLFGMTVIRPLLGIFPNQLKETLKERFQQPFVTDSSNLSTEFERVRWRELWTQSPLLQQAAPHALASIATLQALSQQLETEAQRFLETEAHEDRGGRVFSQKAFKSRMPAVRERILKRLLESESRKTTPASQRLLSALERAVCADAFKGITGHGCVLRRVSGGRIGIFREQRLKPPKSSEGNNQG